MMKRLWGVTMIDKYTLTKSIICKCPAIRVPQSFLEKCGNMAQIILLKDKTEEEAQLIVDEMNSLLERKS